METNIDLAPCCKDSLHDLKSELDAELRRFIGKYEDILDEELPSSKLEDKMELLIKEFFWAVCCKF